ncbi:hypothetical protein BT93_J1518 [Corymbia citriodora subsp. variegata]|nr:hypothetical protein BT93_J1518 [Corymbia citriodora subsp. variegata]
MAFKAVLFLLATFLLITTRVSSSDEALKMKAPSPPYAKVPVPAPAPAKVPSPPTKATPPPAKSPTSAPSPPVKSKADCIPLCDQRCKLHSRKRLCMRACMTCCDRCKCVPPGTYGNQEMCGKCYTDMTTHGNRIKCP